MAILVQFLLRLSFGLAIGMAITTSRQVSSGFFRNNLYVTLGLTILAALASYSVAHDAFWYAVVAAVASYVGSACWLYEKRNAGRVALLFIALVSLIGTVASLDDGVKSKEQSTAWDKYFPAVAPDIKAAEVAEILDRDLRMGHWAGALTVMSNASSGLLMGLAMASMLLGHWYLNSPTMELAPLRRLLRATAAAVVLQAIVAAVGLACEYHYAAEISIHWLLFVVLRWSFGLLGVAVLVWMAWQTLKIPNTQSATGILYVALVGVFVGELTALLLSAESMFPL